MGGGWGVQALCETLSTITTLSLPLALTWMYNIGTKAKDFTLHSLGEGTFWSHPRPTLTTTKGSCALMCVHKYHTKLITYVPVELGMHK